MEYYVVKSIQRPKPDVIEQFSQLDVSTVYEAQGKRGLLSHHLRPIYPGASICGPAVTAICYAGDNLMIHAAIEQCSPGDVLVIAVIGDSVSGMIGELMISAMATRGVQGVVIDAGVRDAAKLREMGFPVWSKAICSEGTTKLKAGWVNAQAICGNCTINPGDLVMADDDGIVVVRKEEFGEVLDKSKRRVDKENEAKVKIARGELSLDFNGFRSVLEKNQVVYYENEEDCKKSL